MQFTEAVTAFSPLSSLSLFVPYCFKTLCVNGILETQAMQFVMKNFL